MNMDVIKKTKDKIGMDLIHGPITWATDEGALQMEMAQALYWCRDTHIYSVLSRNLGSY